MWIFLALLSAFFTAAVGTLSKAGLEKVGSTFALGIQSIVLTICVWLVILLQGSVAKEVAELDKRSLGLIALSGVVSTIAYLCYFGALSLGSSSRVQPIDRLSLVFAIIMAAIFLREKVTDQVTAGALLMAVGAVFIATAHTPQ